MSCGGGERCGGGKEGKGPFDTNFAILEKEEKKSQMNKRSGFATSA